MSTTPSEPEESAGQQHGADHPGPVPSEAAPEERPAGPGPGEAGPAPHVPPPPEPTYGAQQPGTAFPGQQPPRGPEHQGPGYQQPPHPGQPPYPGHPPYAGRPPYYQQPGGDDRTIAVLAHLSPLIAIALSAGLLSFLGPLVVWLIWKDRGPLIRNAAASAFNFNITVWLASVVAFIIVFTVVLIPLSIILWIGAFVAQLVLSIKGALAANRGEVYRYPLQVPILS